MGGIEPPSANANLQASTIIVFDLISLIDNAQENTASSTASRFKFHSFDLRQRSQN